MKLILPVCYNNDETEAKEVAGLDIHVSEYDVRRVVVYSVVAITQVHEKDGSANSRLWIGDDNFFIPAKQKEVEKWVEEAIEYGVYDAFTPWKNKQKADAEH